MASQFFCCGQRLFRGGRRKNKSACIPVVCGHRPERRYFEPRPPPTLVHIPTMQKTMKDKQTKIESLSCIYTNADCFTNKIDELKTRYIECDDKPDIIVISEVLPKNCKSKPCVSEFNIDGYNMFPDDWKGKEPRGILLYTKTTLCVMEVTLGIEYNECVWVKIDLINGDKLLLGCIYQSPDRKNDIEPLVELLTHACTELNFSHLLILGDFNLPYIDWSTWQSTNSNGTIFLECLRDCFLHQMVSEVTRSRGTAEPRVLDLILVNDENLINRVDHQSPLGASDHCVLSFKYLCSTKPYNSKNTSENNLNYNKANFDAMRDDLSLDWPAFLDDKNAINAYAVFSQKLTDSISKFVPLKGKAKLKGKPRLQHQTIDCIKRKHRLWKRYIETRDPEKYKEYCKTRNKLKNLIDHDRKIHERSIAKSAKSNSKNFWKYVNSKRKVKATIPELHADVNGEQITAKSDTQKANLLATFFSSVFTQEDEGTIPLLNVDAPNEQPMDQEDKIKRDDVKKLLLDLNPSKSPGPDRFHPLVLKELAEVIALPLSIIFNKSYESGMVPEEWKNGQISALHKKGDKSSPSNYRPVSLTSIICKTMEKIIREKIVLHMDKNHLFSDRQYGFIKGRSTTLQLLKALDQWTAILDDKGELEAIYMDFMKAFDKVPHKRLIHKLTAYKLSTKTCNWVENFLTNRKQRVCVNGSSSEWHPVTSGIPQGSVLGPILFVIFINDLPHSVQSAVLMFADDTKLYKRIESHEDIDIVQKDLDRLYDWSKDWLLQFHPDKCKTLQISSKRHKNMNRDPHTMKNNDGSRTELLTVNNEKDVGVIVDKNLEFEKHIQSQVNRANRLLGVIKRTFKFLDRKTFIMLFKSLVRPVLEYASSVWSPYKKKLINIIENVQRRATKMVPTLKNISYENRLRFLKLPTLKFRRTRGDMIETFKILHGIYDDRVTGDMFQRRDDPRLRGHSLTLYKSRCRLDVRKYSFTQRVVDIWNSLPEQVVSSKTVNDFKINFDRYYETKHNIYSVTE